MGQTLSEPITAKQSSSLQNKSVKVGSSSMQGWRISMEDAHTHILTLAEDKDAAFFAGNIWHKLRTFPSLNSDSWSWRTWFVQVRGKTNFYQLTLNCIVFVFTQPDFPISFFEILNRRKLGCMKNKFMGCIIAILGRLPVWVLNVITHEHRLTYVQLLMFDFCLTNACQLTNICLTT